MGAWGAGPFDNDAALDMIYGLKTQDDLARLVDSLSDPQSWDRDDTALALAEVIAAAAGAIREDGLYQSEGTTLLGMVMAGGDRDEAETRVKDVLGGDEYLPPEIAEAVERGAFKPTQQQAQVVAQAVREHCLDEGNLNNWGDPERRERTVKQVLTRLEHYAQQLPV